jgi:hypothetical protein
MEFELDKSNVGVYTIKSGPDDNYDMDKSEVGEKNTELNEQSDKNVVQNLSGGLRQKLIEELWGVVLRSPAISSDAVKTGIKPNFSTKKSATKKSSSKMKYKSKQSKSSGGKIVKVSAGIKSKIEFFKKFGSKNCLEVANRLDFGTTNTTLTVKILKPKLSNYIPTSCLENECHPADPSLLGESG